MVVDPLPLELTVMLPHEVVETEVDENILAYYKRRAASNTCISTKPRKRWTEEETEMLRIGMKTYGHSWVKIKSMFPQLDRTNVQLKDRARAMRMAIFDGGKQL
jgi:hypothetical protein